MFHECCSSIPSSVDSDSCSFFRRSIEVLPSKSADNSSSLSFDELYQIHFHCLNCGPKFSSSLEFCSISHFDTLIDQGHGNGPDKSRTEPQGLNHSLALDIAVNRPCYWSLSRYCSQKKELNAKLNSSWALEIAVQKRTTQPSCSLAPSIVHDAANLLKSCLSNPIR